jgi:probable F420-dependent oxidoreductase
MKLDTGLTVRNLREVPAAAKKADSLGFDAIWSMEAGNDGFLPLTLAAEHTQRIKMGPAVAIAFPRSPMSMAYLSWDLAGMSQGRFILGLGTQVKGHIERRYGMRFDPPVPKLREYLESLHAIFACWAGGKKLSYKGQYYNFSLMTPFFAPQPHEYSNIPIYIAGVNQHICRLAGELCQGLHAHPFNSAKYLRESIIPNIEAGLKKAGRPRKDFSIACPVFVAVGKNDEEIAKARNAIREQISFYASTRTYKGVLDAHGWGDAAQRLNEKAAKGDWKGMASEITDEMLDVYAVAGTYDKIGDNLKARYNGLLDRLYFYLPYHSGLDDDIWRHLTRQFNG